MERQRNGLTFERRTFMTMVLPAARAGPSFQACIRMGKFQGMICPTTPAQTKSHSDLLATNADKVISLNKSTIVV